MRKRVLYMLPPAYRLVVQYRPAGLPVSSAVL